jgi:SGNH hydrolase-like domain, acetyltransferase AlgX
MPPTKQDQPTRPRDRSAGPPLHWNELRFLIPVVILSCMIADVSLRFLPRDRVMFRAWEAVTLYATAVGNFQPVYRYENDRAYGDLSSFGNLPRFRQYHKELFTTNSMGFRNLGIVQTEGAPSAIVVGDSFASGSGLTDDETLSAQLSREGGAYVYNGGGQGATWTTTHALIDRLRVKNGLILWEISEAFPIPASVEDGEKDSDKVIQKLAGVETPLYFRLRAIKRVVSSWFLYSPLKVFLERGLRSIQSGHWLPNPSEDNVVVGLLKNGDRMLFLRGEVENFYHPPPEGGVDYFVELNSLIRSTGNRLLVILVPSKYDVYYPLLKVPAVAPTVPRRRKLERELVEKTIPVVNLTALLRSEAAQGLPLKHYNYWIDDTHWNAQGIRTAAAEVLRRCRALKPE